MNSQKPNGAPRQKKVLEVGTVPYGTHCRLKCNPGLKMCGFYWICKNKLKTAEEGEEDYRKKKVCN